MLVHFTNGLITYMSLIITAKYNCLATFYALRDTYALRSRLHDMFEVLSVCYNVISKYSVAVGDFWTRVGPVIFGNTYYYTVLYMTFIVY